MALTLHSPWSPSVTRSFSWVAGGGDLAGHNPLNPTDARFYEDGEWLQPDGAGNVQRGGTNVAAIGGAQAFGGKSYQIFGERGRSDATALAGIGHPPAGGALTAGKATVIMLHQYEGETDMCDLGPITAGGVGTALEIATTAIGGVNRRALAVHTGAAQIVTEHIEAYVVSVTATQVRYVTV
jgi:hypothetical protein